MYIHIYIHMYTLYIYVMDPATHVTALHAFIYCLHTRFSPSPPLWLVVPPPQPIGGVVRRRMGPYNYIYMIIYVYTDL